MADAAATPTRLAPRRGFLACWGLALVGVAVVPLARAEWHIARHTTTVTILANTRRSLAEEDEARRALDPRDDVAEIYGTPVGSPVDLVVDRPSLLITPREEPGRRLLPVELLSSCPKPLFVRMEAALYAAGTAAVGLALFVVGRARRRRASALLPPPPPSVRS